MKHSNRIFLALFGLLLLLWQPNDSKAQTTYSYGSPVSESFRVSAYDTNNDTYLMGGVKSASPNHALLSKLDAAGTPAWVKEFTHTQSMDIRDIHIKDDGNAVVLALTINTTENKYDALVMEVDPSGNTVWSKTYVNTGLNLALLYITPLSSGDYILTGRSSVNSISSFSNYYPTIIRIDSGGTIIWQRRETTTYNENIGYGDAIELSDGSLLTTSIVWYEIKNTGNYHNGFVAKIDLSDGSAMWNKIYPSSLEVNFYQPHELPNGDIAITGRIADSNSASFTTARQLFLTINSTTGAVQIARDYNLPGGQVSRTFKEDATTGNLFFGGERGATAATSDRDIYWMELTNDGSFVDGYEYALSDYDGAAMLEINSSSIHLFSTTKSFPADPLASANNDFAMFSIDRNNILADCNISQFTASPVEFSFSALDSVPLTETSFSVVEADVTLTVDDPSFLQADVCQEENPLLVDGVATDGDCDPEGSIDITVSGGEAPYSYIWSNGAATEDLTALSTGAYTITVTDAAGSTATATFNVFSDDIIQPVALCQSGTIFLDATGNAIVDPFMVDAGSSDNCGEVTLEVEPNSFSCADVGTQTIFLYVTDMSGNTDVCQTTIDVIDNISPTALCQDITIPLDATGNASIDASMIDAGSSDACGIFLMDLDITTFYCSNIGPNTVTLFVSDPSGGTSICTATVTVENNNDILASATTTPIPCDGTGGMVDLTVTGGIPDYTFQWSNGSTDEDLTGITAAGSYNVIITDACGNQIEQSFDITEEACCTITGVVFQEGCDNMGTCDPSDDVAYVYVDATATNGGSSGMFNAVDVNTYTLLGTYPYNGGGVITVPYTSFVTIGFEDFDNPACFTDAAIDLQPCPHIPTLSCSNDINAVLDGTSCEVVVNYDINAEICEGYTLTQTAGFPSGTAFPLGTTVVTYELSNGTETITCSFNVNVSNVTLLTSDFERRGSAVVFGDGDNCFRLTPDQTNQRGSIWYQSKMDLSYDFNLDFNIYLGADDNGADGMMFILQPLSTDLGGIGGDLGFSGVTPSIGIEFDTWQNDEAGYVNEPDADHIAIQKNGILAHDISGYLDGTVLLEEVGNMETGAYRNVIISWDAISQELTYLYDGTITQTVSQDIVSTIFGNNPYVYWGWAASTGGSTNEHKVCVNSVVFVSTVTAEEIITDISCGGEGEIDLEVSGGTAPYTYLWSDGSTNQSLDQITVAGDYTVVITDACGNTIEETYTVEAECCPTLSCPSDIYVTLDGNGCETIVDYEVDAEDCDGTATVTLISGLPSGASFPLGTTVVTYELSNGTETITCSFNVNVSNVAPTAADYVLTGNAAAIVGEGDCYQLTTTSPTYQSGSIYYQARLNLDYDFQLDFEINLGSNDGGADGMMFILQPISSSLGGNGGNLGFSGIGASVGIEFDTWRNSWASDPQNDHISFQRNGNLRHTTAGYLDATVGLETVPNMEVGAYRPVSIKWNATTKELTYIYNNRPARTVTQDIANTIFGGNPNVFWGWSAGTGIAVNNQSVCITSVSFVEGMTVDATVTDVPCDGTGGMIDLTVSGGILGYTFQWSDGTSDEDLSPITMGGDYTVTIIDACGNTVEQTYTVGEEECPCEITGTLFQEGCDNMGTCDPSDDVVYLLVNASGVNGGASGMFNAVDVSTSALLGTFPYNVGGIATVPYTASITIRFEDFDNPECFVDVAIDLQPCEAVDPTLACPDDINAVLDGTGCEVVVDYVVDADLCEGYTLTQTAGLPSGSAFPLGTTVVTYELSNGTETITCSFNVNVSNVAPTAADYVLTGNAAAIVGEGDCYQLTTTSPTYQSGSIYYQARLNLDYDFQLDFEINLGSNDGGADGMMFILQPISSSLGGNGGNLGFSGIGASVGIEFDTWRNSWASDPQNDHISFQRNGNLRHTAAGYLDATVGLETVPNMEVGAYRPVSIKWNATTKELTYIYNNRPARTVTQDIASTIFGGNPNVFWGWSAGTGSAVNNQSVCITSVSFVEGLTVDATITDIPCNGLGEIDLTVSGGIPGYTFQWSDGTSDEDLSSITTGGDYSVTITDACGHTVIQTYTVGEEVDCDCEITSTTLTQEGCENMSTSDTSDDIITLFVNATADNGSGSFNIVDASTFAILGTFPYGTGGMITVPYSASISLIYEDAANPECSEANAIDLQGCEYCTDLNINIVVDNYPKETSWELIDANGNVIQDSNGHLGQNPDGTVFDYNFCLPDGCYEFIIYDSYGDGICCDPFYGNGSYTVTDVTSNTVLGQGGQFGSSETTSFCFGDAQPVSCTYEAIKFSNFENGWGFWVDGGEDAERMVSPGTVGTYSIRLRDNTSESVMTSKQLDLTNYTEATIDFAYRPISMDNATEDFFLEISLDGGVTFSIVEEWNQGDEFINGRNYVDAVVIPGPFSSDTRFRFRCDAGGDGDYVFIDRVTISGCEIDAVASKTAPSSIHTTTLGIGKLYPNPAHDYVNIEMKSKVEGSVSIHIYRTTGQLAYSTQEYAYEGKNEFTVNLDKLTNGTYMVEINDGNKTDIQRLVIMK